jgi:hypothetical protein
MKADVVDRQWDTQGSVTMKSITILDYITRDSEGKPTHLLETESLTDGNFISTRFAVVTQKGLDFARNYTKLQDSVFAQMSLVKIRLERQSLATLLQFGMDLQHYMERYLLALLQGSPPPSMHEKNLESERLLSKLSYCI